MQELLGATQVNPLFIRYQHIYFPWLTLNAEATTETNGHKGLFGSVVVVVFQNAFHSEMYQNDIFLFFKNYF
jgi:multisubunit Na+/H+ antiporter MnhE subunit